MKDIYLLNFPDDAEDGVFGAELEEALLGQSQTVLRQQAEDFLLDLGNGRDLKPVLVLNGQTVNVENSLFFLKKRLSSNTFLSTLLANFLPLVGARSLNALFKQHLKNVGKQAQAINLVKHGYAIPYTVLLSGQCVKNFQGYIEEQLQYPMVLKASGSGGHQVWLVNSFTEIEEKLLDVESKRKEAIALQEFIANSDEEYRVVMLLDEIVAVIVRGSEGFYNNMSQGGDSWPGQLQENELRACHEIAQLSGLDYLGIDFMRQEDGTILFTELQTGPSFSLIKKVNPQAIKEMASILTRKGGQFKE